MQLRTNTMAINAHRNVSITGSGMATAMHRLSSGFRINTAADDPSGLAISESMRAQIRGLDQASRNAQDGIALIGTADGAMSTVHGLLHRIRELIVQAANDTNVTINRESIQVEIDQLMAEIDLVSESAEFNNRRLLDGSLAAESPPAGSPGVPVESQGLWLQAGAGPGQGMTVNIGAVSVDAINEATLSYAADTGGFVFSFDQLRSTFPSPGPGLPPPDPQNGIADMTGEEIGNFLYVLNAAVDHISLERASLGAMQSRLEFTTRSLDIASENLQDAESRVRNADMALEMMRFVRYQVLQQTGVMMLAQANRNPGTFVELLG